MKRSRYTDSRQKSCHACSSAKAKCSRNPASCDRCTLKGLPCRYPRPSSQRNSIRPPDTARDQELSDTIVSSPGSPLAGLSDIPDTYASIGERHLDPTRVSGISTSDTTPASIPSTVSSVCEALPASGSPVSSGVPQEQAVLDFSQLAMSCPINADDIRNRWLNSYVPFPGQVVKNYPSRVLALVFRLLKAYTSLAVRGRGLPPFLHATQILAASIRPPLSTCLSLVRVCDKILPGSEPSVTAIFQKEMAEIYEQQTTYDELTLLNAFQAYLIYSMVLFFCLNQRSGTFLRQAIMNLQEIACASARQGLLCSAEEQRTRPTWEAWIVAEAKRRTLYTMYFFDNVLSSQDGLPTYLGTELRGLPAPGSKYLWQAQCRSAWETEYNTEMLNWAGGSFHIDELWPATSYLDDSAAAKRRTRVDKWLETLDEFGTLMYAVTSGTHGN